RPSFFQPLDLHVEPTDLLVEFGLEGLVLVVLAATAVGEERLGAVEELLLPLADLDRVDLKGLRQLGKGPGLLGGLQGDPGLEGRGIALAFACHDAPRDGTVNFDQFNIPSGPVFGVHFRARAASWPWPWSRQGPMATPSGKPWPTPKSTSCGSVTRRPTITPRSSTACPRNTMART